jgi:hypothetical protein
MRIYRLGIVLSCLTMLRPAAPALGDGPQTGASTASASNSGSAAGSIRLGPPPASSAAASSITLVLNPPGSLAICRDYTTTSSTDPSNVCSGHLGVLDWIAAPPVSATQQPPQTRLDGAVPAGLSVMAAPSPSSYTAALPATSIQSSQSFSVQGPVSFQGPSQATFIDLPLPSVVESMPVTESSEGPSPEMTAPEVSTPSPTESAAPNETSPPESSAITSEASPGATGAITPPPDCQSYTGGPCVTHCADGAWSSSSGSETCSDHGGVISPDHFTGAPPPEPPATSANTRSASPPPSDPDSPTSPNAPRTAQCIDGSFSYNPDQSMACLQHGGIEKWLGAP